MIIRNQAAKRAGTQSPRLFFLLTTLASLSSGCDQPSIAESKRPAVEVEVVTARVANVPETAQPNGKTRALNQVSIRARVRGVLEKIEFKEGQDVAIGTPLFQIEKAPFQAARDSAAAKLAEAEASLQQARESKAREIAAAQLDVEKAVLKLAQVEEARQRALMARVAASQDDLDRAVAARARSAAQVESEAAKLAQANADFDINIKAAEAKVLNAKAELEEADLDLGYCTIVSPIAGRIGEAKIKEGNLVGPMANTASADYTELATIEQLDPMGVDIECPSRYLERATELVNKQLEVMLERPDAESTGPKKYTGSAFFIDNKIDPATSTVLIKASVNNPRFTLLPGEYVKLDLVIGHLTDAILVPERAVIETQEGPSVLIVDKENKVQSLLVESTATYTAPATDSAKAARYRVITGGLDSGARVVVDGIQLVRPGDTVTAKEIGSNGETS